NRGNKKRSLLSDFRGGWIAGTELAACTLYFGHLSGPDRLRNPGARRRRFGGELLPQYLCHCVGLVVHGQPVHDGSTGIVEPDDLDLDTCPAEFEHGNVDSVDPGQIPDMGPADVNPDGPQGFGEVEGC